MKTIKKSWIYISLIISGSFLSILFFQNFYYPSYPNLNSVNFLSQTSFQSWILKSVCVNYSGQVLNVDPYPACPVGTILRKINANDPIPYNNSNQLGYQISDSFVMLDKSNNPLYLHNFDYAPFDEYNMYSGSDGFDVFSLVNGLVSYSNTRDGGGFNTTFFGANCSVGGGWVLFPQNNFLTNGDSYYPINGVYWEHNGQGSFGSCPSAYSTNSMTTWNYLPSYSYGGINGNPVKTMATIVSYHGYETSDGWTATTNFKNNGHLEVFYYTREYGRTRWEVWTPVEQTMNGGNKQECNGVSQAQYKGQMFNIQYCHDWSKVIRKTVANNYAWPLPNANLLQFAHFEGGFSDQYIGTGYWNRAGFSAAGNLINWSAMNSKNTIDGANFGTGVRYLATNCAAANGTGCGQPGTQFIYQDIPINKFCSNCNYLYGVNARMHDAGQTGTLQIAIQLVDSLGRVVWQDVGGASLLHDNGDAGWNASSSVVRSSKFVYRRATMPTIPTNASFVRFLILPITTATFDVVDAYVNPVPKVTNTLLNY